MASHGYLGDLPEPSYGPKFTWDCPRIGCKYSTSTWTEGGLRSSKEFHNEKHEKEDRERMEEFAALPLLPASHYQQLVLTLHDINMFECYHIKIDEDCVIDGYGGKP
jgi:hypothetical protein